MVDLDLSLSYPNHVIEKIVRPFNPYFSFTSTVVMLKVSVTRLGHFSDLLVTNFHIKVDQIFSDILGYSESITF